MKPRVSVRLKKKSQLSPEEILVRDLDDSSDEEMEGENLNQTSKWKEYNRDQKHPESENYSFELHRLGLSWLYGAEVASLYRSKKSEDLKLSEVDTKKLVEEIYQATELAIKETIKYALETYYKKVNPPVNEQAIYDKLLGKAPTLIEDLANLIIRKRQLGRRAERLNKLLIQNIIPIILDICDKKDLKLRPAEGVDQASFDRKITGKFHKFSADLALEKLVESEVLESKDQTPDARKRRKDWDFSECLYPRLQQVAWEDGIQKIVTGNQKLTSRFSDYALQKKLGFSLLEDLTRMDKKAKNNNEEIWELVQKNPEIMDYFVLNNERITPLLERYLVEQLKKTLGNIKIKRPTYRDSDDLISRTGTEFLGNLRLSNISVKRQIANQHDEEDSSEKIPGIIVSRTYRLSESSALPAALEQQEITTTGARNDKVLNLGAYKEVVALLSGIKEKTKLEDKVIARWIRQIINGVGVDQLCNHQNQAVKLTSTTQRTLVNIAYLFLGTETVRNPGSLIANWMILDLVENGNLSWEKAFSDPDNQQLFGGGMSPMSMGKYDVLQEEAKPEQAASFKAKSAEVVPAARQLHNSYNAYMPVSYSYPGPESSNSVDELIRREVAIAQKWELEIGNPFTKLMKPSFAQLVEERKAVCWSRG